MVEHFLNPRAPGPPHLLRYRPVPGYPGCPDAERVEYTLIYFFTTNVTDFLTYEFTLLIINHVTDAVVNIL